MKPKRLRFFVEPWGEYFTCEFKGKFPEKRVVDQNFVWLEYLTLDPADAVSFLRRRMETERRTWEGVSQPWAIIDEKVQGRNDDIVYIVDVHPMCGKSVTQVADNLHRTLCRYRDDLGDEVELD